MAQQIMTNPHETCLARSCPYYGKTVAHKHTKQQAAAHANALSGANARDNFNKRIKPGDAVILILDNGMPLKTRTTSEAWCLGDGTPIVSVEGKSGGWLVERVRKDDTVNNLTSGGENGNVEESTNPNEVERQ